MMVTIIQEKYKMIYQMEKEPYLMIIMKLYMKENLLMEKKREMEKW